MVILLMVPYGTVPTGTYEEEKSSASNSTFPMSLIWIGGQLTKEDFFLEMPGDIRQ
jgi:hypothetical protein